jgi:hypothetical protein
MYRLGWAALGALTFAATTVGWLAWYMRDFQTGR